MMMIVQKRTKLYSMRVQPNLLDEAQKKLNELNSQKKGRDKKMTLSDLFEEKLYDFVLNNKK